MSVAPELPSYFDTENSHSIDRVKGPLRCSNCGYEIVNYRTLPACPMCREISWEPARWRPFTRPRSQQ
jgi:hypothetical protein